MTTYPLSEPATIHGDQQGAIIGQGTLADCAEILEGLSKGDRAACRIEMDALDLRFDPPEIEDLLRFLRNEDEGLSNNEIAAIADPER